MSEPSDLGASYAPLDELEQAALARIERRLRWGNPGLNMSLKTGRHLGGLTRAEELARENGLPVSLMLVAFGLAGAAAFAGRHKR